MTTPTTTGARHRTTDRLAEVRNDWLVAATGAVSRLRAEYPHDKGIHYAANLIERLAADLDNGKARLMAVLDREAETQCRHDKKLDALEQRRAIAEAENVRLRAVMERCAMIVVRNLYHQREKVEDVPTLLRAALSQTGKDTTIEQAERS